MSRKCESGVEHHTIGEIRGCSVCQRNGHAGRIHARFGNEDSTDVLDPQPQQTAPPVAMPPARASAPQPKPQAKRAPAKKARPAKPKAKPKAKRRR